MNLSSVGGGCAVLTTVCFLVGIVLMASSGVQVLIPDTGVDNLKWIDDVDSAATSSSPAPGWSSSAAFSA
jgi:hypothetical protein